MQSYFARQFKTVLALSIQLFMKLEPKNGFTSKMEPCQIRHEQNLQGKKNTDTRTSGEGTAGERGEK